MVGGGAEEREHSLSLQELLTALTGGEPAAPVVLSRNGPQFGSFIVDKQKAVELKPGNTLWDQTVLAVSLRADDSISSRSSTIKQEQQTSISTGCD